MKKNLKTIHVKVDLSEEELQKIKIDTIKKGITFKSLVETLLINHSKSLKE